MDVRTKRIYEPPARTDGFRILVDRLWPRGVKKEAANIDLWMKDVAPSTELRKWFGHEPEKWERFAEKYADELTRSASFDELKTLIKQHKKVTLLFSAKDEKHNQAEALKQILKG